MQSPNNHGPAVRRWQPDIAVREVGSGTLYIEQRVPLPAFDERATDALVRNAEKHPDKTLFAARGKDGDWVHLTYAAAVAAARSIGQFFLDRGLDAERPLAILSGNSLEHAMLALGALHVGIPYAAVSPAYSIVAHDFGRLRSVLEGITPGLVFADDEARFGPGIAACLGPEVQRVFLKGSGDALGFDDLRLTKPTGAVEMAHDAITGDTIAKFLFTSGSTGAPKAVINTHRMIGANAAITRECFPFLKDEPAQLLDWAPWHHTAGGNQVFFMAVAGGGTLFIDEGNPTPIGARRTARNLKHVRPNWYFNVPRGFDALLPLLDEDTELSTALFANLRMLWYAGASLSRHTWDGLQSHARKVTGSEVLIATGLGATETAPTALVCSWPTDTPGNVGLPGNGVSLKLVPMDGKLDARVKGPNVMPGYWRQPELTAKAFDEEGYYRFGDALRPVDPDNMMAGFQFDGRTAENFKLDTGTWVSTGALRTRLIDHFGPLVRDVAIAGADRPYLSALVFPDFAELRSITGLPEYSLPKDFFSHPETVAAFSEKLQSLADFSTGSSNLIQAILLVDPPPSLEDGEATDKGSINQRAVLDRRADLVEAIYAGTAPVIALD